MKKLVFYFSRNFMLILLLIFCFGSARSQTKLIGATRIGGNDFGTIYTISPGATSFTNQFSLRGAKGDWPVGSLITAPNGKIYGMTAGGGIDGAGVLFEYDYLTNTYTHKIEFRTANGAAPWGSLLIAGNGKMYGTTSSGGANGGGAIFEYDYNTNTYTKKIDLDAGMSPFSTLLEVSSGKLYGLTRDGGANNKGVIFEYDYNSNTYTKKIDLSSANGSTPFGSLIKAANGKLYGLTSAGGSNDKGVVFEYDYINNIYTKKIDLATATGTNPHGSLKEAGNGKLYGMTLFGGSNGAGVLFEYDYSSNTYSDKFDFSTSDGLNPEGNLMEAPDGKLYGITAKGGFTSNTTGTVFQYDYTNNVFTKKLNLANIDGALAVGDAALLLGANGKLYGLKPAGGLPLATDDGRGVLFEYDYVNNVYVKKQIIGTGIEGENPIGALVRASNSKIYGATQIGGNYNRGAIYEYSLTNNSYTKLVEFDNANGARPNGTLTEAANGNLYGTTGYGGSLGNGVIYEFVPATNTLTKKLDFPPSAGRFPSAMVKAGNGKLYGYAISPSTIFEYDVTTNTAVKKIDLGSIGAGNGIGSLIEAPNGKLYGLSSGSLNETGALIEYDYTSNSCVVKFNFSVPGNGHTPAGSLTLAPNGKLYGLTSFGGANNIGVIFEYDIASNTYTKKLDFTSATGGNPYGTLLLASNGKFYGNTNLGGTNNLGVLFEYDYVNNSYVVKKNFTGPDGAQPYLNDLLEVPDGTCTITPSITNNTGTTVLSCTATSISVTATGGLSYVWDNSLGNTANATITAPGTYTVTATDAGGCTGTASITVTQVPAIPGTPAAITGFTNVCPYVGTAEQLTYSIAAEPGASSYQWVIPPTVTLISGQGTTSITVTINSNFSTNLNRVIKVSAVSACGSSTQRLLYLQAQPPSTPGPITASSLDVCASFNSGTLITYSIASVLGASSYVWTVPAGSIVVHPNAPGVNDTTINVGFASSFAGGTITVQAVNNCGTSAPRSINIVRNNPSTPGLISGPTNSCAYIAPGGVAATYSVANTAGITYTWTIPAGSTGLTGQGTNSISFTYPAGFTSGTVSVTATNPCGTSGVRSLNINRLIPATPGNIGGSLVQDCPNRIYTYSILPAPTNTIVWTIPLGSGGSILSGQGTNSITVFYPPTAISGSVTAQAVSSCGASSTRSYIVALPACAGPRDITTTRNQKTTVAVENMEVNVFPNPTTNAFQLQLLSAVKQVGTVIISDVQGREIKRLTITPGITTSIGNELKAGTYLIQVIQAENVRIKRVVKL